MTSKRSIWFLVCLLITVQGFAQEVEVIRFKELETLMTKPCPGLRVFNFWATWCKPCLEELPEFETLHQKYDRDQVTVYLISLDFVDQLDSKLKPFLEEQGITANVKLLDETDFDSFIDKVDPRWSGAIPATLIMNQSGQHFFFEKQFSQGELQRVIRQLQNL